MAAKYLVILALVVLAQGQQVNELQLPDETTTHLSNPLIPKTIGLPIFFFDTVVSCNIIFPNGQVYELTSGALQNEFVEYAGACGVGFRNAPPSMSGTYELISRVDHVLDGTSSLIRQRYHLTFYYDDSWQTANE